MRQKFYTIQYLRGFAAMLVLASHALLYPLVKHDLGFGRLGWLGVILFFVISGFIMVVVTGEGRFAPADFLRRRFIRIVPMYWGATLIAALLALLAPQLFKTTVYDTGQLVLSLLFIPFHNPVSGGIHPLYKLGWTLNYEIFFYLCFALLAFLSAQARVVGLTFAFAGLAVAGVLLQPEGAVAQFYTSFMPLAFCAGAWIGLATLRGTIAMISKPAIYIVLLLGVTGLGEGMTFNNAALVEDGMAFVGLLAFASAVVLMAVRLENLIPRIRSLEFIGDASYSIYLVHIYEVAILAGLAFRLLDPADLCADYLVAAVSVAGGTVAGIAVYRWIEMPALRFFNRVLGRMRPEPVPAAAN